jgi:hypothetical protein
MIKTPAQPQQIDQSADAAAVDTSTYEAPRVVDLGRSSDLIRGNANISNWDYSQGSYQWYQSGE